MCLEDGDEVEGCLLSSGYRAHHAAPNDDDTSPVLQTFDAIMLDIMMRRTNGVDVLRNLFQTFGGGATTVSSTGSSGLGVLHACDCLLSVLADSRRCTGLLFVVS